MRSFLGMLKRTLVVQRKRFIKNVTFSFSTCLNHYGSHGTAELVLNSTKLPLHRGYEGLLIKNSNPITQAICLTCMQCRLPPSAHRSLWRWTWWGLPRGGFSCYPDLPASLVCWSCPEKIYKRQIKHLFIGHQPDKTAPVLKVCQIIDLVSMSQYIFWYFMDIWSYKTMVDKVFKSVECFQDFKLVNKAIYLSIYLGLQISCIFLNQ